MSKHKNQNNPDHYKLKGGEPQGGGVLREVNRQQFAEAKVREKRNDPRDGAQDLEMPPEEQAMAAGRQTSVKMGKQSSAKKMEGSRYNAGPIPKSGHVPGAFGHEPHEQAEQVEETEEEK